MLVCICIPLVMLDVKRPTRAVKRRRSHPRDGKTSDKTPHSPRGTAPRNSSGRGAATWNALTRHARCGSPRTRCGGARRSASGSGARPGPRLGSERQREPAAGHRADLETARRRWRRTSVMPKRSSELDGLAAGGRLPVRLEIGEHEGVNVRLVWFRVRAIGWLKQGVASGRMGWCADCPLSCWP